MKQLAQERSPGFYGFQRWDGQSGEFRRARPSDAPSAEKDRTPPAPPAADRDRGSRPQRRFLLPSAPAARGERPAAPPAAERETPKAQKRSGTSRSAWTARCRT